jgi:hypothetical protein
LTFRGKRTHLQTNNSQNTDEVKHKKIKIWGKNLQKKNNNFKEQTGNIIGK